MHVTVLQKKDCIEQNLAYSSSDIPKIYSVELSRSVIRISFKMVSHFNIFCSVSKSSDSQIFYFAGTGYIIETLFC